jgi:UDP-N-acetylmuramate dehydrogenase
MRDAFASEHLLRDVPLAPLTTFRIGGPARYFRCVRTRDELVATLRWSRTTAMPLFVLGGGSNVVVSDQGFDGLVLQVLPAGLHFARDGDSVIVRAAAGVSWNSVVEACLARNLAGIECLAGIPGLVGGVPIQNVGAYGQEVAGTLTAVDAIERATGAERRFQGSECGFAYRRSRFNTDDAGQFIIISAELRLKQDGAPTLVYPAVREAVAARYGPRPALQQVAEAVVAIRRTKSMVIDDDDVCSRSAGSFFLNPTVDEETLAGIRARAARNGIASDLMPVHDLAQGWKKLSSAWLIEKSGFPKGYRHGDVAVSPKHPLAIVNLGRGTAAQVRGLAREIRTGVAETFGVELRPEPIFVGWTGDPLEGEVDA